MSDTKYIESKIDGEVYCKINGRFTRHLQEHGLTYKDYYESYVTGYTPLCACGSPLTLYQPTHTYANSCGDRTCAGLIISNARHNASDEKKKQASENYKKAQANKTKEQKRTTRDKANQTYFEKYGTTPSNSSIQKSKAQATKLAKYGDAKYNNSNASAEKNRNKTPEEQDIINQKRRDTNLEVHGVACTFLKPGNLTRVNRSNAMIKPYILPSSGVVGVRGYEPLVLDMLFNQGYKEYEIKIHDAYTTYDIEVFEFKNANNHISKYYPDIYIAHENKIIEVKGRWWWDGNGEEKYKSRLSNNLKKRQAVLDRGYVYELWLFEDKKNYKVLVNDSDF